MIEAAKLATSLMKAKKTSCSFEVKKKRKMLLFSEKKHIKGGKYITPMDFVEYLRKSLVSENSKVYYGRFLRNGLKDIVILVKVDEMRSILTSASHCLSVDR